VKTIVDTGPLVALLNARDRHHAWAAAHFARLRPPLLTCDAVLSETAYLLGHGTRQCMALLELVERGVVAARFRYQQEAPRVKELIERYASVPMAFADACLLRMAELYARSQVWTVDGDFRVYRKNGREVIPSILPA
jgi:predicted nucleic acid-binding protein